MKPRMKSMKVTHRQLVLDSSESTALKSVSFVSEEKQYDDQERLLMSVKWAGPDYLEEKLIKRYEGNTVTTEYYIDESEISEKTIAETDDNGLVIKETVYYADGTESVSTYEYDDNKPMRITTMDIDEYSRELSGEHKWLYDEHGHLLKEEELEYEELVFSREMKYDEQGNLIFSSTFHAADGKPSTEELQWSDGHIQRVIKTDIYGTKSESLYQYNEQGEIKNVHYSSPQYNSETTIEFNENNEPVHEKEVNAEGVVMYEIFRSYNNDNHLINRLETYINRMGRDVDVHYTLEYEYTFHE